MNWGCRGFVSSLRRSQATWTATWLRAVSIKTGVPIPRWRRSRNTSKPLLRGSITSRIRRSNPSPTARARPSSPSPAVSTRYPSLSRRWVRVRRSPGSSSTSSMRGPMRGLRCVKGGGGGGKDEGEGAAAAGAGGNRHSTAVRVHDALDQAQAEAAAADLAGEGLLAPEEGLEEPSLLRGRDPEAVVLHRDPDFAPSRGRAFRAQPDPSPVASELDRVLQKVDERASQRAAVGPKGGETRLDPGLDLDAGLARRLAERAQPLLDHGPHVHVFKAVVSPPGLGPAEVNHLLDHLGY